MSNRVDWFLIALLFLTLPLFFYKLGQSSLISFDEAWYGGIAKEIVKTGDFLNLTWNGNPYFDHPPAGFWLMALSIKLLGESEWAVRFPSAILGFLSLIVVYFLGKELFSRVVGFASAAALSSSFWFIFRARSGNLDVPLTFFFLLTLLLALKSVKSKNFLLPWSVSLAGLFLTKTLVPFTIIPALFIIFWKSKFKLTDFLWPLVLIMGAVGGWFLLNITKDINFIKHYLNIGLPGIKTETNYLENLKLIKEYLHSGIGKWFWPGVVSVFFSLFLRQKRFLILSSFFTFFFIPFVFSQKGHIWHLIPLHPILILSFFGLLYVLLEKIIHQRLIVVVLVLALSLYFSFIQIKTAWYQFIDIPAFVSDEAILSKEAKKFSQNLYADGDFVQTAVYYSDKKVKQIHANGIPSLFETQNEFLLITKKERLDGARIAPQRYTILKSDRDKILIIRE